MNLDLLPRTTKALPQNSLLLDVLQGRQVSRPPVWLMRQAGRILPEYRAIRQSLSGFIELVTTPDLAAEVTVQPVDILGVDAAILFSDILVIPEAMGLPYEMIEARGPVFPNPIQSPADIERLISGQDAAANLQYVYNAIDATLKRLDNRVPLIGFSGAPWTLFAYMIEGKGSKNFGLAKKWLLTEPVWSHILLEKITDSVIAYLQAQIHAGIHVAQVFDSWGGMLSPDQYAEFSTPYLKRIADAIAPHPTIIFPRGAWFALGDLAQQDNIALGIDWQMNPNFVRQFAPNHVLQGNLDPTVLYASPEYIADATKLMIAQFGGKHIVNLGHGVNPDTPLEGVRAFIKAVKDTNYEL
jgi:uroporphyrinogen decarboxylase